MTEERQEKNRRISEWLGVLHGRFCQLLNGGLKCDCGGYRPDFYADPAANELILEKARFSIEPLSADEVILWRVGHTWMNGTVTMWASGTKMLADRKESICEAALAYIESLAQEKK